MIIYYILLFITSAVLGFTMHRSDFCLAGAFRDIWLIKRFTYIKAIFLIIFLSMLLFQISYSCGIVSLMPYPLVGKANFGNIIGGLLFGIGMVLAGGCVIGVLYKMAMGTFIYFVAFMGIIIGSVIYIIFNRFFDSVKNVFVINSPLTLDNSLNINTIMFKSILLMIMLIFILKWQKQNDFKVKNYAQGFINPFYTAVIISFGSLISYIIAGMPLGVTTTYTKLGVFFTKLFIPDLNEKIEIINKIPLNYYNSFLERILKGGYAPKFDGVVIVQLPAILGIFFGSFISAISLKEFKLNFKAPLKHYIFALSGGMLMGLGARIGSGCNVWHILGGLSILANNAILFLLGLLVGSFIGAYIIKKEF
jgi:uncharacterized membrane protein YedE/YeeE